MTTRSSGYAILHITGADAADFLRAQLTSDVQRLDEYQHRLTAWCDAKGRVLCIFRILKTDTGFIATLPAELAESITRRLRMYVLRARVEIEDVTTDWALSGVLETGAVAIPQNGQAETVDSGYILGIDTGHGAAGLCLQPGSQADNTRSLISNQWQLLAIDAGLPEVTNPTSAQFVPQMLNLHWLGGVDFDKGCYPGQEVVARLQFRGRLTRRLFRMQWRGTQPAPGDDIRDDSGKQQGTVIRTAETANGEGRLLAVVRVDAVDQALSADQAQLTLLELPYSTEEQATAAQ